MIKANHFIFLVLLYPVLAFCQSPDSLNTVTEYPVRIDSVIITGNKITEPYVILRELTFKKGDYVTRKTLEYNRERIFSLGIFTRVRLYPEKHGDINLLYIEVSESWYIYPIPYVELQDRDWKKFSYGINLLVRNFRGRNETVLARAGFGYDPSAELYYELPYFIRSDDIYMNVQLVYRNSINRSTIAKNIYGEDFKQKFISGYLDIGKRFGLYNKFDVNIGYEYVKSPAAILGISASGGKIDRQPVAGARYIFDTRDLAQFPSRGFYALADFESKGFGLDGINYQVADLDLREYRTLFDGIILKWRFATRQTFGKTVPYYDYSYLGYNERIRGHFNQEREGNNSYVGSLELNYPIIRELDINLDFIPIIPQSLLTYRLALYAELFTDTGAITMDHQPLALGDFKSGYGTGLSFLLLPYSALRIEYALDEYKNSEWILGLGISF